jgi:TetR/AcrR family transcriptional regulator
MRRAETSRETEAPKMREELLEAATRRFAASGFDGVSLQDIADDVEIRKASLLYHFPSKELLREAALEAVLAHWSDVLPRLMNAGMGERRRLDAVMQEAIAYFANAPHRGRLLLREMLDHPDDLRARMDRRLGPWLVLLADFIRRGQSDGRVYADLDPEAYVFHVLQLVLASVAVGAVATGLYAPGTPPAAAMDRHLRELFRLAKSGLFTSPQRERG